MNGRMLNSKKLRASVGKSKYVTKSRTSCLEEAKLKPIIMGKHILENSTAEKYLGDQISKKETAASITGTIDKTRIGIGKKREKNHGRNRKPIPNVKEQRNGSNTKV